MNKGIVLEMDASSLIVMTPDGHFERIPRKDRNCGIGEEILYSAPAPRVKKSTMAWASSLVAAAVFCLVLFTGMSDVFANKEVVAYVSMDINPSVEIGLDRKEKVRELKGLNSDGEALVNGLDYAGKKVDTVADELLAKADPQYLSGDAGDIVITSSIVKSGVSLNDEQLSQELKQQVQDHLAKAHPAKADNFKVTAFATPKEALVAAHAQGLSPGKYAVYLGAMEAGEDISLDEFKQKSLHEIAQEKAGVGKLLADGALNKATVAQLVSDEKDGTLDQKRKESQKEKLAEKLKTKADDIKTGDKKEGKTPRPGATPKPTPKTEGQNSRALQRDDEAQHVRDQSPGDGQGEEQSGKKQDKTDVQKQDEGVQRSGQDTEKKPEDNRKAEDDTLKQQGSDKKVESGGNGNRKDDKNAGQKNEKQSGGHTQNPAD